MPDWLGLLPIAMAFAFMTWLSWRKWPDLIVDFGMEVYLPWKISTGSVLYRDVMYLAGGPVSQYYHALLFKLFGASLNPLLASNFIILGLLLIFIYRIFLRCADQLTATTICLAIVLAFAFAQYLGDITNYNYICPYSHELTHGIALSILSIALLSKWLKTSSASPQPFHPLREEKEKIRSDTPLLALAGLCFGLVFLTKAEVSLALTVAVVACFYLAWRLPNRQIIRWVFIFFGTAFLPLVGFFLHFKAHSDFSHSVRSVAWAWSPLLTTGASQNNFYKWGLGMDQPWFHLQKALIQLLVVAAVLGVCFWRFKLKPRNSFERILVPCLIALLVTAATFFDWKDCGYSLPLLTLTAIGILFRQWLASNSPAKLSLPLLWAIFSLALMAKLGVYPRIWHYGFALAMPAAVTAIYLLLWLLPNLFEQRGVNRSLFRITMALLIFTGLGALVLRQNAIYRKKTFPVGSGANCIMAFGPQIDPKGAAVAEALQWIEKNVAPSETLAVLPEGVTLNFLSQRSNSAPYLVFNPAEFQAHGEANIFEAYRKNPPDYILLVHRDASEFGVKEFGQVGGFGVEMMNWINENYKSINLIGHEPLQNGLFGIKFLKKN